MACRTFPHIVHIFRYQFLLHPCTRLFAGRPLSKTPSDVVHDKQTGKETAILGWQNDAIVL